MNPPWSLRIQDEAPLTVVALVQGTAWVVFDGDEPQALGPGDVAIIRGPLPYTVADEPYSPPHVVIHPGQVCTTPDGESLAAQMDLGVRTWGNCATGSTKMLTGTYTTDGEISQRLLDSLPTMIVVPHDTWDTPLIQLLADEIGNDAPGQEVVLDRLLDLLLIAALRTWFARAEAETPAWFHAHGDSVIGPSLRMLTNEPTHPWSVASLAAAAGMSRASFARRFNEVVGEPPMTFLAGWRLALAADLLREPDATVTSVARRVGYNSPFTFSTAFKRLHGVSPKAHRDRSVAAFSRSSGG